MGVTMQDIADRAGVSRGTVDRALNRRGRIDPEVQERVLQIARDLGYTRKKDRGLPKDGIRIGIVTQLSGTAFMEEIRRGIRDAGEYLGLKQVELLLRETPNVDEDEQLEAIDSLADSGISALALMPVDSDRIRQKLNELSERKHLPIVTFNSDIVGTKRLAFVGMDNAASGRTAAGLMGMLTRGSGSVLIITGSFINQVNSLRVDGFLGELRTSFPGLRITGVHSSYDDPDEVEKIIRSTLDAVPDLTGILVISGGQSGIGAAFSDLQGRKRPFVITYDLVPWNRMALSTDLIDFLIDQGGYRQGYLAPLLLGELLLDGKAPDREFYYTDIDIRTRYNL